MLSSRSHRVVVLPLPLLPPPLLPPPLLLLLSVANGLCPLKLHSTAFSVLPLPSLFLPHLNVCRDAQVPPPMLLIFKTNDCLRHAERQLSSGVNSLAVMLKYCFQALAEDAHPPSPTDADARGLVRSRMWLRRLRLRLAVWLLKTCSESELLTRVVTMLH